MRNRQLLCPRIVPTRHCEVTHGLGAVFWAKFVFPKGVGDLLAATDAVKALSFVGHNALRSMLLEVDDDQILNIVLRFSERRVFEIREKYSNHRDSRRFFG